MTGTLNLIASLKPNTATTDFLAIGSGTASHLIVVGTAGLVQTSTDGVTFTPQTSGTVNTLRGVTSGFSTDDAVGDGGTLITSTNDTTWSAGTSGVSTVLDDAQFLSLHVGVGAIFNTVILLVGASGVILASQDGTTFTSNTSGVSVTLKGTAPSATEITNGGQGAYAVGASGTILLTTDSVPSGNSVYGTGVTTAVWSTRTSPTANNLNSVASGSANGGVTPTAVAVGDSGTIISTTDDVTWTVQTSGTAHNLHKVVFDLANIVFVAVGDNGTVLTSRDGVTWTSQTSGTSNNLYGALYNVNSIGLFSDYFVGANSTHIGFNMPGQLQFAQQTDPNSPDTYNSVAYNGSSVVVAVAANTNGATLVSSPDGVTWTARTDPRFNLYTLGGFHLEEQTNGGAGNPVNWNGTVFTNAGVSSAGGGNSIVGNVTSGAFTPPETITQTSTGATLQLLATAAGTVLYFNGASLTGTPDATHIWTGGSSGATFTPTTFPIVQQLANSTNGTTWTLGAAIPDPDVYGIASVGSTILILASNSGVAVASGTPFNVSTDNGATVTSYAGTGLTNFSASFGAFPPCLGSDGTHFILAYMDSTTDNIRIAISTDGHTWTNDQLLSNWTSTTGNRAAVRKIYADSVAPLYVFTGDPDNSSFPQLLYSSSTITGAVSTTSWVTNASAAYPVALSASSDSNTLAAVGNGLFLAGDSGNSEYFTTSTSSFGTTWYGNFVNGGTNFLNDAVYIGSGKFVGVGGGGTSGLLLAKF